MPEGHVIHRLAGEFTKRFAGRRVAVSSPQGRFAAEAARIDGATLVGAEAVGKHLFLAFDRPEPSYVHIHLGLIGRLEFALLADPVGQVRLRVTDGEVAADLRGPQWCRAITVEQYEQVLATSGPDPLRADADPAQGLARVQRSGKSIAALLMDQRVAAGVGNIFRAEVLFRHGIDPTVPGRQIDATTWDVLWRDLVDLMARAVEAGRIDTVAEAHSPENQQRPPREDPHGGEVYVYRRAGAPCLVCGTPVSTATLEGRNLYWCPRCQVHPRIDRYHLRMDLGAYPAYLFDLDGVITPTAEVHMLAWGEMFNTFLATVDGQQPWTDDDYFTYVDGKPRYDGVRDFLASRGITLPEGTPEDAGTERTVCGLGNAKNDAFNTIIERDGVDPFPGSKALIDALVGQGAKLAVVSSSKNAVPVLRAAGLDEAFPVIVDGLVATAESLPGKPAPDMFWHAAKQLGVEAKDAVVIEDALSGIAAGAAGGFALVVGVDRGVGRESLAAAGADLIVDDLGELVL